MPSLVRIIAVAAVLCLGTGPASLGWAAADDEVTREELVRQQNAVERHLLRVQQERFEARARGEDPRTMKRLEREFKRTYGRRNAVIDELKRMDAAE